MIKPSIEQRRACDALIKDLVSKIWIEKNIYKRNNFKVYEDLELSLTYLMMRDIDNGVWDNKKVTAENIMKEYCK